MTFSKLTIFRRLSLNFTFFYERVNNVSNAYYTIYNYNTIAIVQSDNNDLVLQYGTSFALFYGLIGTKGSPFLDTPPPLFITTSLPT